MLSILNLPLHHAWTCRLSASRIQDWTGLLNLPGLLYEVVHQW